ncbi:MAG: hypothetical protein NT118_12135 [Lentisphaerae bacterium]|nr:hypothetical protein [Lentisphaerota bacterium]
MDLLGYEPKLLREKYKMFKTRMFFTGIGGKAVFLETFINLSSNNQRRRA